MERHQLGRDRGPVDEGDGGLTTAAPVVSAAGAVLHRVVGKRTEPLNADDAARRLSGAARTELDVGTGDGRFVVRRARALPQALIVGIDPAIERMADAARETVRPAAKGGVPNALFVRAAVESLPDAFSGAFDAVHVLYPWGSLLTGVVCPDAAVVRALAAVCKPAAAIDLAFNRFVLDVPEEAARVGLAPVGAAELSSRLATAFAPHGFAPAAAPEDDPEPARSTWGARLVRGAGRATLRLAFVRGGRASTA